MFQVWIMESKSASTLGVGARVFTSDRSLLKIVKYNLIAEGDIETSYLESLDFGLRFVQKSLNDFMTGYIEQNKNSRGLEDMSDSESDEN